MNTHAGDTEASRAELLAGNTPRDHGAAAPRPGQCHTAGPAFGTRLPPAGHRVRDTAPGPGSATPPSAGTRPCDRHSASSSRLQRYSDPHNPGNIPNQSARRSLQNQLCSWMVPSCCCLSPTPFPQPSDSTCKQESEDADHSWPCQHWCRGYKGTLRPHQAHLFHSPFPLVLLTSTSV